MTGTDRSPDGDAPPSNGYDALPPGTLPEVRILEVVGALQLRHARRQRALAVLRARLAELEARIERHLARVAQVHAVIAGRRTAATDARD